MMSIMRKIIHNNIYKVVLWMFLFMMAIGGGLAVLEGQQKNWVMRAYGQVLSKSKFHMMLQSAKKQQENFRQKGVVFANKNIEKETVSNAIGQLLTDHVMEGINLTVPSNLIDTTIQKELGNLPSYFFHANGELNREVFERAIAPLSIEDFLDNLSQSKKDKLLYSIIDLTTYTPEFELAMQYNVDFANKSYSVMTLPLSKYIAESKKKDPTDQELAKFYKKSKNNEAFKTPERRAGVMWQFNQQDYVIPVSQNDIKAEYDKNKQSYLISPAQMQIRTLLIKSEPGKEQEARQKIEKIKEEAEKKPEDFSDLVKKFSEDKEAAAKGGLSEIFKQDDKKMNKLVVKTAFESLSKDYQISSPVKVDDGYVLIQRVRRVPSKYKELKDVEVDIKKELVAKRFKQRFQQDATRVVSQARYNPEALESFVEKYKASKKDIALAPQKAGSEEAMHLFKIDEHKYAVFFDKNVGVILQCTEIEKSKVPALEEVKSKVVASYHEQEGKKQLEIALAAALKEAQKGSFEDVSKKYDASVQKATFEYKDGKPEQSAVLKQPAVSSAVKLLHAPGGVIDVATDTDGMLLRLDSVEPRNQKVFEEQKEKLAKTMFYAKKYQVKDGFVASLYRHAKLNNKIELKDDVLQFTKES